MFNAISMPDDLKAHGLAMRPARRWEGVTALALLLGLIGLLCANPATADSGKWTRAKVMGLLRHQLFGGPLRYVDTVQDLGALKAGSGCYRIVNYAYTDGPPAFRGASPKGGSLVLVFRCNGKYLGSYANPLEMPTQVSGASIVFPCHSDEPCKGSMLVTFDKNGPPDPAEIYGDAIELKY